MTTEPTALLRRTEAYLAALHGSVARHDNLAANLACAGCELRDEIRAALAAEAPESDGEPYAGDERPCLACNHSMDSHIRVDGEIVCVFEDCSDPTPAGVGQDGAQPQEDHRG